ncbi:hypothetical protein ABZP36_000385 [Zizania latifolia]
MGNCNCNCFERERARVTAWGGGGGEDDDYYYRGTAPVEFSGPASFRKKEKDGEGGNNVGGSPPPTARLLKIRMTKGQLRRLLDGAGKGLPVEDVVTEIMSMGEVLVEPVEAAEGHRPPPKLETIQEDDMDEY